ncbi:E3 ubiquitin-protein ligase RNF6 isoform X2 [Drosophila grimshawi]|nr:E3 ubiquitin-protein ligase RNF6 isoform X2 [Drosophila grimshawi]
MQSKYLVSIPYSRHSQHLKMGKCRTAKQTRKRPTSAQQNIDHIARLETLIKEKDQLVDELMALTEQPCKKNDDEQDSTQFFETNLNNIIDIGIKLSIKLTEITSHMEKRMQTIKSMQDQLEEMHKDSYRKTCTVCLSETSFLGKHRLVCLPCGHIYGKNCIVHWLEQQKNCPQCRKPSRVNQVRNLIFPK